MKRLLTLVAFTTALGAVSWSTTGCVAPQTQQPQKIDEAEPLSLPFQVSTREQPGSPWEFVPQRDTVIYRWASKEAAQGLAVDSNAYASVRAIDVATGEIIWIETINVRTHGISETTSLERMGITMAENFAGKNDTKNALLIYNGEPYHPPYNWAQVANDWPKRIATASNLRLARRRKP